MEYTSFISDCISRLSKPETTVKEKYDTLFELKSFETNEAIVALMNAYEFLIDSDLLKHELMYILGQSKNYLAVDFLIKILNDDKESPVVRHEAGEALANYINDKERIIIELKKFVDSEISVIRSTARIAITKLVTFTNNNNYQKYVEGNIEPADPFTEDEIKQYIRKKKVYHEDLLPLLLDPSIEEFVKYKIMYFLRNQGDEQSLMTFMRLLDLKNRKGTSPLMRHEVCFIIGQLHGKADFSFVKKGLFQLIRDTTEEAIVRHEAILSYSDIWGCSDLVDLLSIEKEQLVLDSILIVID